MDYKKLLGHYTRLPININHVNLLTNRKLNTLNEELFELLSSYTVSCITNKEKEYLKVYITKEGIKFDLSALKNILCMYFSIENDENILESINKIKAEIGEKGKLPSKVSKLMGEDYNRFKLDPNIKLSTRKERKAIVRRRALNRKTNQDLELFKDLILNEKKYSRINGDLFDEQALGLYLAHYIMTYADYLKTQNDEQRYSYAIEYLKNYLDSNLDLLKKQYTIPLLYRTKNQSTEYSIRNISVYLKKYLKENRAKSENIEKYDYNFFESDNNKTREILKKALKLSLEIDNSDELKKLLERKIELYTSLNYTSIKIGVDSYEGYIGFRLENGYIILDKLFDNIKEGKIANNNAIYIINENEFEKITRMTKTQTIEEISKGTIKAKRIIHSGNFENKVKTYTRTLSK